MLIFIYFLFSFIIIEYVYYFFKKISIEQLENNLKNTVELAYNDIIRTFEESKNKNFDITIILATLKTRLTGPLERIQITLEKKNWENHLLLFFQDMGIPLQFKNLMFKKGKQGNIQNIIVSTIADQIQIHVQKETPSELVLTITSSYLDTLFYYPFCKKTDKEKEQIIRQYQLRFFRNLEKATVRIGKDGYVYGIQIYRPDWFLPDTKFPEDYTLERIQERFRNGFREYFQNPEDMQKYFNRFGKTPEEQYQWIRKYMNTKKKNPDPAIVVIHPYLEFVNLDNANVGNIFPVRHIILQKNGFYRYIWKNPIENRVRIKVAYLKSLDYKFDDRHFEWVIGIGAYEDESYYFVNLIRKHLYIFSILFLIFVIIFYYYFTKFFLLNPMQKILKGLEKVDKGDYNVRLEISNKDELGYISFIFNKMTRSIRKKNQELENYARNLHRMVEERTQQLETSLKEISRLKESQEGDYYLVSLLLKQLEKNLVQNSNIQVEFFVKGKKEFQFRNKKGEIGGDICIARTIFLREIPYIFFLNADAMGKSMQGAAGGLIIASVIESILERTMQAFIFKNYNPERWLKNSFMELKHIFDSFQETMGATLIMGLIDEQTGTVYYINAEHPPIILYRSNKASFLNKDFHFRRLGMIRTRSSKEMIFIKVFPLKKGDILFMGSDGKDDIRLSSGEINDDENLILKIIEEEKGNIKRIYKHLQKIGEIIDDFSLLKIIYHSNQKKVSLLPDDKKIFLIMKKQLKQGLPVREEEVEKLYKKYPDFLPVVRMLVQYYYQKKDYEKLEIFALKYFELFPASTRALYLVFYVLFKQKKFSKAIDFGERYYLRDPEHIILLLQLAQCYYRIDQFSRAEYLINKAMEIDPNHPEIPKWIQKIQKSI